MSVIRLLPVLAVLLALMSAPPAAARQAARQTISAPRGVEDYHRALKALDAYKPEIAEGIASRGRDPLMNKVIRGYAMMQPGNDYSFTELAAFISDNPDWPGLKLITLNAEQKLPAGATAAQLVNWFAAHPPITLPGFYRQIDALNAQGQTQTVPELVRERWIDGDMNNDEQRAFYAHFSNVLRPEDHAARLDRLLWKEDSAAARRMYPYTGGDGQALGEARLALANLSGNAETLVSRLPQRLQQDPGLLYERLRWRVRNNLDDSADDILLRVPQSLGQNLGHPEAWWDQRQIMIRRALERHDPALAYRLAAAHGQTNPKTLVQGEFLAGWLALRFLNKPQEAVEHFATLYDNASTPISRARGAYWLGRAYEAANNKPEAEQSYETAAALDVTYYGQLAAARLSPNPVIRATPEPAIPPQVRAASFARDTIRAAERLTAMGETERARSFFHAATEAALQRVDFVLLTELAYQIKRPDLAIMAAKAAAQKNILVAAGGYPLLDISLPRQPEPAFIHALIRQESMFNPDATSPAGARGLMQLMPRTAKDTAKHMGIKYKEKRLTDPDFNVKLGVNFVQHQLDSFNGSYVMALAGYNAGPGRVHEWIAEFGDPRSGAVDPIDWIELMPINETRNYVQRIIESLQIYRARLNGGQAPLRIMADLKR